MAENGPSSPDDLPPPMGTQASSPPGMRRPQIDSNKTRVPHPMVCKVQLLSGEEYETTIDKRAEGQLLFERVCDYLDLLERDYFCLVYRDDSNPNSPRYWLDLHKKIRKQKSGAKYFEFALKFYPPDPTQLTESLTRYLVTLQIRRDIMTGRLPCSKATHALLGSYAVQADIGDYDPLDHGTDIDYLMDMHLAPDQTEDLLYKIAAFHKQHKGLTPEQAELRYLEYSKKIALYGMDLHKAKDSDYVDILLGVGATGISVYRDNLRINRFVWPKILKISYRRNKFLLRIRPAEFETFESWIAFRLENNKMAKRLWKIAVEHHAFLRLRSAEDAKKRTPFHRFGSKYRYSGRTLYETRQNSSMADRPLKTFDRTHSRQSLNSVLNNNRARSHDTLTARHEPYWEQQKQAMPVDMITYDTGADREPPRRAPVANHERIEEDRTPLQSPLPRAESPKFTRTVIRHNVRDEEDDLEERLPSVPRHSPEEIRRASPPEQRRYSPVAERRHSPVEERKYSPRQSPQQIRRQSPGEVRRSTSHQESIRGAVATPLAAVALPVRQEDLDDERERPRRDSMDSMELKNDENHKEDMKPPVAPKPGKPPVAKKPEKAPKPEKPPKPEKAPKPEKPPKPEKAPKPDKSSKSKKDKKSEKKKEPMTEVSL